MAEIQIKSLISNNGTITLLENKKEIVIKDKPENLKKIEKLLKKIDKSNNINTKAASFEKNQPYIDIIKIRNISSAKAINLLNEVFEAGLNNSQYSYKKEKKAGLKLTAKVKLKNLPDKNELMIIANAEDNRRIKEVIALFDKKSKGSIEAKKTNSKSYISKIIRLRNLKAIEATQIINSLINQANKKSANKQRIKDLGYLSKSNFVTPVPSNNSIIISGNPKNILDLSIFIKELDKPQPQVLIEVTILEVSLKNGQSIGFEWSSKKQKSTTGTNFGVNAQVLGGGQGFFYKFGTEYFDAVLNAIQETTDVKVLAAPHLLVTNNRKAIISIGDSIVINKEKLEIPTSDVSNPIIRTTHEYIDVGLKLEITPKIGENGLITLDIAQDVNDVKSSGVPGFPELSKRNLQTTIIAKDRESLVMGGLINRKSTKAVSMVPLIGHIPVFGRIFRKSVNEVKTTELVLFVTAYIIKNNHQLLEISEKQKNKMTEIKKKFLKSENSKTK